MFTRFPALDAGQLDATRQLAGKALATRPGTLAYLGGSVLVGLGTPRSDVDLFLVTDLDTETSAAQILIDGVRVDVETVPLAWLTKTIDRCTTFALSDSDFSQLDGLTTPVMTRLIRFALGEIVADDGRLRALHRRLDDASAEVTRLLVAGFCLLAQNSVEDVEGFLAIDEPRPARLVAEQALLQAAEALLIREGDVYLGTKWVWHRWRRSIGERYGAGLVEYLLDGGAPVTGRQDILRMLWLTQGLALCAIGPIPHRPVTDAPRGTYRRDPFAAPVPTVESVLVYRSGRSTARISYQGAYLFAVAHGRGRDEAVSLTVSGLRDAGYEVSADDVARYLDTMVASGLLRADG